MWISRCILVYLQLSGVGLYWRVLTRTQSHVDSYRLSLSCQWQCSFSPFSNLLQSLALLYRRHCWITGAVISWLIQATVRAGIQCTKPQKKHSDQVGHCSGDGQLIWHLARKEKKNKLITYLDPCIKISYSGKIRPEIRKPGATVCRVYTGFLSDPKRPDYSFSSVWNWSHLF